MEILLYELETSTVRSTIKFKKSGRNCMVDGYDRGKTVKELFGGFGYEYSMSFDEKEFKKLSNEKITILPVDVLVKNWIKEFIGDPKCFTKIKIQFDKYGVEYKYFSWRDGF